MKDAYICIITLSKTLKQEIMKREEIKNKIRSQFTSREQLFSFMEERGCEIKNVYDHYSEEEEREVWKKGWVKNGEVTNEVKEYALFYGIEISHDEKEDKFLAKVKKFFKSKEDVISFMEMAGCKSIDGKWYKDEKETNIFEQYDRVMGGGFNRERANTSPYLHFLEESMA